MIRIAVVEDMARERSRMKDYVENYFSAKGIEAELLLYTDGKEFLDKYPDHLDILLLDIEMKELDGISTAHQIRSFDENVQILFVTRMIQYALEGYAVDAADFIVKPVRYPVFCTRMDRVLRKILINKPRYLTFRLGKEELSCQIQKITCIEALNKKTIIHLSDREELLCTEPLYQLEKRLEGEPFFRCHNAFLVNMNFIHKVSSSEVSAGNQTIPVSKYRKKEFFQALTNYRGRML